MSALMITGGRTLEGTVHVHGAKNSVLPILAASILAPGVSVIENCPPLSDVTASLAILNHLGCRAVQEGERVTVRFGYVIDGLPVYLEDSGSAAVFVVNSGRLERVETAILSFDESGEFAALLPERQAQQLAGGECGIIYRVRGGEVRPEWAAEVTQ